MCTPEGRSRLELFADFNLPETEMVVQAADWMLAADSVTNEQYAEVIRKIFVERLDLDPSAFKHTIYYDFIKDEDYYTIKHDVTEEKLLAVYGKIKSSHFFGSETRELALALAQARARAGAGVFPPKAKAEQTADDEPTTMIEESSLDNIDSCDNEGKVSLSVFDLLSYISFVPYIPSLLLRSWLSNLKIL